MKGTIIRCHKCGAARQTKRNREPIAICFCLPWEGERPFVKITNPRELGPASGKFVQRE
jgi:hypothetical protein